MGLRSFSKTFHLGHFLNTDYNSLRVQGPFLGDLREIEAAKRSIEKRSTEEQEKHVEAAKSTQKIRENLGHVVQIHGCCLA